MGMALARVISEATLSMMLLCLAGRFGLLTGLRQESARAFAKLCFACGVGVGPSDTDKER